VSDIVVFSGSAHRKLAEEICSNLGIALSPSDTSRFSNDCLQVQLLANCRQRDVYIVQPLVPPTQDHLMELLLMVDAARGASAASVTVVIPHYAYARSDKKDASRISIGGRLVADLMVTAGANRVITMALHAPQVHGFFGIPTDHLTAIGELADHFRGSDLSNAVVVSPDLGNTKRCRNFAEYLDAPLAIIEKRRIGNQDKSEVLNLIGTVDGCQAVIVDDEIDTAGSITQAAEVCLANGATEVYATCVHPVFSGPAIERLQASAIKEVVVTDTIDLTPEKQIDKITVLSVASLLGETIQRIHTGASVSAAYRSARALR